MSLSADRLFSLLSTMHPLTQEFRSTLASDLKSVAFPKGHYLVQAQTPSYHAYYLEKGFCLSFQYQGSKRVVTAFWQPGDIILSPSGFFKQQPTNDFIQLTADSELLSISYDAVKKLSAAFPVTNFLARDIAASYHSRCEERIVDLHTLNAWERYKKLLRAFPGIELQVSQELIASYLNVTPQSLSRLKAGRQGS